MTFAIKQAIRRAGHSKPGGGGSPSYQTAAFVQQVVSDTATQNPAASITSTAGNLLIAVAISSGSANSNFPSAFTGGWTKLGDRAGTGGTANSSTVYYKVSAGGTDTPDATYPAGTNVLWIGEFSGVTSTFTSDSDAAVFGTARTFAAITTAAGQALIAIEAHHNTSSNYTYDSSGSTLSDLTKVHPPSGSSRTGVAISNNPPAGSHTVTSTWTTGRASTGWVFAINKKTV